MESLFEDNFWWIIDACRYPVGEKVITYEFPYSLTITKILPEGKYLLSNGATINEDDIIGRKEVRIEGCV